MKYLILLSKNFQHILISLLLIFIIYYLINIGNKYVHITKRVNIKKGKIILILVFLLFILIIYNVTKNNNLLFEIISLFFYSVIISYALNPIVNFLEKKGITRSIAILILYLLILAIFVFIILAIIPKLSNEFEKLIELMPSYINDIYKFFDKFYLAYTKNMKNLPQAFKGLDIVFSENLNKFEEYVLVFFRRNIKLMINFIANSYKLIIIPILSFYFLKDKEYFKKKIYILIPSQYRKNVLKISKDIDKTLLKFLKCQLISSAIVGTLSGIALLFLNINFAITIGITIALFEIVPYFGPFVGIVLTVLFGLTDSLSKAIIGVVVLLIIQQIENNLISPKIVGDNIGLHPIVVILAVIIGGGYFGLIGMILAIPVTSTLKILMNFFVDRISQR